MTIILCGLPTSGKSSLGKALAKFLNLPFYDLDDLIVSNYSSALYSSSAEIYKAYGDQKFSECEARILETLPPEDALISLGGGTLMYEASYRAIQTRGALVFLSVELPLIYERLEKRGLPERLKEAMKTKPLSEILTERIDRMKEIADYIFPVDHVDHSSKSSLEQASQDLITLLKS
ncbi:shikimate kinase [Chlamydia pneumoniae TW-183]|uniref:Shikimate kinase n=2 Tax=Chlamydia pneumoniae TaxID=83558 RepID=AROK_CHLPN|nr:shikimate kinase [Chlamydia pneumoniae]Q9Z6M1.1 RecName: Full=Shikimate kinase; Short=SK [Chlamydia pneumoniae]AAD19175.1 Shikimate Kinase II [Chlamydia pneumoniae CWL029]AAF38610.1 shikimate kinase [Chlamydia pneumoniae AR39]AAP99007.1 shikimate kinase [Chlamydia pneumoniae TW-183]ACZ32940.1 shikimate kinase [Chlamydia pneumoniae LPCoLN]